MVDSFLTNLLLVEVFTLISHWSLHLPVNNAVGDIHEGFLNQEDEVRPRQTDQTLQREYKSHMVSKH